MQVEAPQSQATGLAQYLEEQAKIAKKLMDAARYSDLTLQAHRNFGRAKLVHDSFRRARSGGTPNFQAMQDYMAQQYVESPAVDEKQRKSFIKQVSKIQVPRRAFVELQRSLSSTQEKVSVHGVDQVKNVQKMALSETPPQLTTASEILQQADELEKPIEQQKYSTYALRQWQRKHVSRQQEAAALLQEKQVAMNAMERHELRLHRQFWSNLHQIGEIQLIKSAQLTSIYSGASNLSAGICPQKRQAFRASNSTQIHLQRRKEERARSVQYGKSRLSQQVYYEDFAIEKGRARSCQPARQTDESHERGWKGYSINELRCKYKTHRGQSLNEIGLEKTVEEIVQRSKARTRIDFDNREDIDVQNSAQSVSCISTHNSKAYQCNHVSNCAEQKFQPFEAPAVLLGYKRELDYQLERVARANSTDLRRPAHAKEDNMQQIKDETEDVAQQVSESRDIRASQHFQQSLRQIQAQMLLPGAEPLPDAFNHYYEQFKPPMEDLQTVELQIEEPLDCGQRITTDLQKASLLAKAEALNSACVQQFMQLKTNEQEEAERREVLRNYKPPVQLSPEQRYIAEQRQALAAAKFPVETFPQLAIFTKLSSLNVEDVKSDLKQQIDLIERAQNQKRVDIEQLAAQDAATDQNAEKPMYQHNFLREFRGKQAQMWNAEIVRINESTQRKEFKRKHVPNPPKYDGAEIEREISQQILELQGNGATIEQDGP